KVVGGSCCSAPMDSFQEHISIFSGSCWTETNRDEFSGAAPAKMPIAITATARIAFGFTRIRFPFFGDGRILYQRFTANNFFALANSGTDVKIKDERSRGAASRI